MVAPAGFGEDERVVLFDGVCRICNAWVPFVIRRDPGGRLKLCALQSPAGQAILAHLGRPLDDLDTMIFLEHGVAHYRSTAFLRIVRYFPFPWPILSWARVVPRFLRDLLYDLIARNRYRLFGRNEACMVPEPWMEERFLGE